MDPRLRTYALDPCLQSESWKKKSFFCRKKDGDFYQTAIWSFIDPHIYSQRFCQPNSTQLSLSLSHVSLSPVSLSFNLSLTHSLSLPPLSLTSPFLSLFPFHCLTLSFTFYRLEEPFSYVIFKCHMFWCDCEGYL